MSKKLPYWVDWACRWCGVKKIHVTGSGESFDGGDDYYNYHCSNCGNHWTAWVEYD